MVLFAMMLEDGSMVSLTRVVVLLTFLVSWRSTEARVSKR